MIPSPARSCNFFLKGELRERGMIDEETLKENMHDRSQFDFFIEGLSHDDFQVQKFFSNQLALSHHYQFELELTSKNYSLHVSDLLGKQARLEIVWKQEKIYFHGIIKYIEALGRILDAEHYRVHLISPLLPLIYCQTKRTFTNQNILSIISSVLKSAGFSDHSFIIKTHRTFYNKPFVVQYAETDFEFIERLVSQNGLFYFFRQDKNFWQLVISDNSDDFPAFINKEISFHEQSGHATEECERVFYFSEKVQVLPQKVSLQSHNYEAQKMDITVEAKTVFKLPSAGIWRLRNLHFDQPAIGKIFADCYLQALDCQRQTFIAHTNCRGLQIGQCFTLKNHPLNFFNGDYRIISMSIKGDQSENAHQTYYAELFLIKTTMPFRILPKIAPKFSHILLATVESVQENDFEFPHLDEMGRYKIRFNFDQADHPQAQASLPVRMLQHFGCPSKHEQAIGLHFPLHAGTQVAVGFIQGDLEQPVILGVIDHPQQPNPVTEVNPTQNILRTHEKNELVFEDKNAQQFALLATSKHQNRLKLIATEAQEGIELISELGRQRHYANKDMLLSTDGDQIYKIASNYVMQIKNQQKLSTECGDIEFNCNKEMFVKASHDLEVNTENGDVALQSGRHLQVQSQNKCLLNVQRGDLSLISENKNICCLAGKNIIIQSVENGQISLGQSESEILINKTGLVFKANRITLEAPVIQVNMGDQA